MKNHLQQTGKGKKTMFTYWKWRKHDEPILRNMFHICEFGILLRKPRFTIRPCQKTLCFVKTLWFYQNPPFSWCFWMEFNTILCHIWLLKQLPYTLGMAPSQDASDHQDYEPFFVGNPYKPLLATPNLYLSLRFESWRCGRKGHWWSPVPCAS